MSLSTYAILESRFAKESRGFLGSFKMSFCNFSRAELICVLFYLSIIHLSTDHHGELSTGSSERKLKKNIKKKNIK